MLSFALQRATGSDERGERQTAGQDRRPETRVREDRPAGLPRLQGELLHQPRGVLGQKEVIYNL